MRIWRLFTLQGFDQSLGLIRRKIAVVFIYLDAHNEALAITFGMKLGGIHILTNPKHLYWTGITLHKQGRPPGRHVTRFFMTKQHFYLVRKPL